MLFRAWRLVFFQVKKPDLCSKRTVLSRWNSGFQQINESVSYFVTVRRKTLQTNHQFQSIMHCSNPKSINSQNKKGRRRPLSSSERKLKHTYWHLATCVKTTHPFHSFYYSKPGGGSCWNPTTDRYTFRCWVNCVLACFYSCQCCFCLAVSLDFFYSSESGKVII